MSLYHATDIRSAEAESAEAIGPASIDSLPAMPRPGRVLMVSPEHFDVQYVINPHMAGQVGQVDRRLAAAQWEALSQAYQTLGLPVSVLPGGVGLPDMVFCANQSLPGLGLDGTRQVWMSRMHAEQRRPEVALLERWFRDEGYRVDHFEDAAVVDFEGMGDAIWHPGRRLLWGGYGFRSSLAAYCELSTRWKVPVVLLELRDPDFYHLDTCFCVLDDKTVLIYPGAFTAAGQALIRRSWPRVIEAPELEARRLFACNAHCPDGRHVLLPAGCPETGAALERHGLSVQVLDTGEFLKSGGSIFCMKLMVY